MIYLLRHGQTDWNKMGRMQGQTDIPLNQTGIETATCSAKDILKEGITRIISSDLTRAKQTAEIINSYLNVPLNTDKRLREISYGEIEGKLKTDISDQTWHLFNENPSKIKAESFEEIYARVKSFFESIENEDNVLIVTHAGFIRMALYFLKNKSAFNAEDYKKTYRDLKIPNTTLIPWI